MRIFPIRHGETICNANRTVQFGDTPLSERGLEPARQLGERMRNEPINFDTAVTVVDSDTNTATLPGCTAHSGDGLITFPSHTGTSVQRHLPASASPGSGFEGALIPCMDPLCSNAERERQTRRDNN